MATTTDPAIMQKIISRYESEEDDFLRELESIKCVDTDTTDDYQEDGPVLGVLCSLVSEIGELRKQNRRLKHRLDTVPDRPRGMAHRVGALLDGSKQKILPRFMSRRATGSEIRTGARERLSSPPNKECLTASTYSTDFSSESATSASSRKQRHKAPPLVLPELSDSDLEPSDVFAEVALPDYRGGDGSNVRSRRSMVRRSEFSSVSDHTSPSSSSVEPIDMTASRSSFLEFIGLRRKKDNDSVTMRSESPADCFFPRTVLKKRKRKISESDSIASGVEKVVLKEDRRKSASLTISAKGNYSMESGLHVDDDKKGKSYSFLRNRGSTDKKPNRLSHYFPSEKDDERTKKKIRPKSAVYLDPDQFSHMNRPLSSKKNRVGFSSRDTSEDSYAFGREEELSHENAELREELAMLRNRNSRLISQLKEKSAQQSHTHTQMTKMQLQMEAMRKRCELNEGLDRLSLNNRLTIGPESVIDKVENRLRQIETDVQNAKAEAVKNHHVTINAYVKDQNSYQSCLEQVERLQRENFSLLQMHAAEMATHDKTIRHKLDLMPSYDALYSFTMGIVRKLGQLRNSLIEKSNHICRTEMDLMHMQSSLLITHAQVERLRLQLHVLHNKSRKRPASYHGENLLDRLTKPALNFLLPFKLHASRLEQQQKCATLNMDSLVESNEQSIETEFLRLFDYARCVSKICEESPPQREKPISRLESVIIYRNGKRATLSPTNSPLLNDRRRLTPNLSSTHNIRSAGRYAGTSRENSKDSPASKRPTSLVESSFDKRFSGNIRKFAEEMKRSQQDTERIPSPNLNLHKLGHLGRAGHVQAVVSSLQDVSNSAIRSPTTTPIMTRRTINPEHKYSPQPQILKATVLQQYGLSESRHYDLPPTNAGESSDYGTINSKRTPTNGGLSSTGFQNKLPPLKPSMPNRPLPPTSGGLRQRQPGNPAVNLKRNPPVSQRRAYTFRNSNSGRSTESPKRVTSAVIETPEEESPPPHPAPSAPVPQQHHNDVLSVSETSSSAAEKLSRLPRLTVPLAEKAVKKATASWLSRLRPSSRK
ncbi:hypothetical protein QR680_002966 [Steinernema hermaphroditum]|uniref:Uncharacterized protein n=1 Tax=Steinernema hermaphroditum TaxID=289476 RepID=A0AA39H4U3_9BILA|nr:hypothetical protein QR680_002966 [Steinernema hermaphroditum]